MKTKTVITTAMIAIAGMFSTPAVLAEDGHDHGHDHGEHAEAAKQAGPNGGKVIHSVEPHYELFVMEDRRVKITFLGEDGKGVAPGAQVVSGIGGDRSNPTKFAFAKDGDSLVSDKPLPKGTVVSLVLRVKPAADAKTVTERLSLNLADCPGCDYKEYACTCESH